MHMEVNLPQSLKACHPTNEDPKSLDDLLSSLYWYIDTQIQLAKKRQQPEAIVQWEYRLRAIDMACQMLDEVNQDDNHFLIY
jgi:hypothetical protein